MSGAIRSIPANRSPSTSLARAASAMYGFATCAVTSAEVPPHERFATSSSRSRRPRARIVRFVNCSRRNVAAMLFGHGLGRHTPTEIAALGCRSLGALAALLGNKAYLMGPAPSGVDATAFAMISAAAAPVFASPLRDFAESKANLIAYRDRLMREFYPAFAARRAA